MKIARTTRAALDAVADYTSLPRPLDPVRSIKLKLCILLVSSGAVGYAYFWSQIGWLPVGTTIGALVCALVTSQFLAHGMTRPLREMTAAARAMRRGDYSRRVRATARDEVGELAGAFNQMADDLAEADRRRRELIANVSHELRTPITALQNVLENVVDGVAEPDARTMRTALAQTERLGRLVTELLDLSRIDAGAQRLELAEFPVEPLLAEVVAEASAAARGVRFAVDVRPPGATAVADRARLHQVVVNLLDNAARHGPAGGEVRVTATVGAELVLEVADDGPGIAPEDRERVFERFTRGERAGGGGTGLGLNIARWIVDLHGGSIAVVDGPGCRIRAALPARPSGQDFGGQDVGGHEARGAWPGAGAGALREVT
ncbi:HAMP domain-containing sensor histidine kinase [Saccharothrix australiensis]|uniref:histidine kinase n=1 Tax=Saccharothrix australiensis TaxID=2072 RepID=A0A495W9J9_9PSEU|nr:HAMP domain-containing sensor histidine kinase [Saccharothrix australiensis]RKT57363.1 signal transduction histidine kinase [Saccharothrix australiensis]